MSLYLFFASIAVKKIFEPRLTFVWPLLMLTACQTLPPLSGTQDPDLQSKHEFSLVENQSVLGQVGTIEIEAGDSLPLIARYFGLGFDEITQANPQMDPWLPEQGQAINLPLKFVLPKAPRKGVVLNLAAKRMFYYPDHLGENVITFPVGIGREGWRTPTGATRIVAKKAHPRWVVPESVLLEHAKKGDPLPKIVPAGPNNPLGEYALRLGIPGYLIHGTNKPYGVGMEVSHGCIRLYPEDIALLFSQIEKGTPVRLVHQPYLVGWENDDLSIQVYPSLHARNNQNRQMLAAFKKKLQRIERQSNRRIDWRLVDAAVARRDGIPVSIFADASVKEAPVQFTHPPELSRRIQPAPLVPESWRIKVAEFSEPTAARRLTAMLNHQGPPIPAHALPTPTGFMVVAGPFKTIKVAQASIHRLRIDFALRPELIKPGTIISVSQEKSPALFSRILSVWN